MIEKTYSEPSKDAVYLLRGIEIREGRRQRIIRSKKEGKVYDYEIVDRDLEDREAERQALLTAEVLEEREEESQTLRRRGKRGKLLLLPETVMPISAIEKIKASIERTNVEKIKITHAKNIKTAA